MKRPAVHQPGGPGFKSQRSRLFYPLCICRSFYISHVADDVPSHPYNRSAFQQPMSMSGSNTDPLTVVRLLVSEIQEKRITFIAASLAYYAFISLFPLLLFLLAVASLITGDAITTVIITFAEGILTPAGQQETVEALTDQSNATGIIGIGAIFLVWSALKIFRGIDIAFSDVYGTAGPEGIVDQVRDAVITLGAIILAIIVTIVIGAVLSFFQLRALLGVVAPEWIVGLVGSVLSLSSLALALYPLYYFLPSGDVNFREALPGAIFTALGWTLFQTIFRFYAANAGNPAYGIIGGALLLATLLYFGSLILLLGVALNAILAGRIDEQAPEQKSAGLQERVKDRTQALLEEPRNERTNRDKTR